MIHSKKPELLAPAGTFQKLKYALAFGADAVYAGIPRYSLRTRENDFRSDNVERAIRYVHQMGRKIYLTLNIYAHNAKADGFLQVLDEVAELQPDALIMSDPGLIGMAVRRYPDIPIHLSTQANVTNWAAVKFWQEVGISRIILSRELKLQEIAEIHQQVPDIELEAFVHGAICIAYSGRCLISNYLTHRDANQGTCTNSCRWEYKLGQDKSGLADWEKSHPSRFPEDDYQLPPNGLWVEEPQRSGTRFPIDEDGHGTYLFNARDLCAVELLKEIQDAGVVSFKIEGRTKSAYYAAMTARAYRRAVDDMAAGKAFDIQNLNDLMALSNRSYTTGFYTRNPREYGENYNDSRSRERSHKTVGLDIEYDENRGMLRFEARNRLEINTDVELITPGTRQTLHVVHIENARGESVDVAHGGAGVIQIPCSVNPGKFTLIQRALYPSEIE